MTFIRKYVVVTEPQLLTLALWVIHTYGSKTFVEQTPYLAVTSPETKCGKSRLLEVLGLLVERPWYAILPSEAVVYRHIHFATPTFLLDEIDAIFNPRTAHHHEGLRAILDAGHRQGAEVPRCVGSSARIFQFRVFCPKVVAGIGSLPDTVSNRSIPIRLQRRTRAEPVEKFTVRKAETAAAELRDRIASWVEAHIDTLQDVYPPMPEALDDRMQEGCESLVAIADASGVGSEARTALVELLTGERWDAQETMRLLLLRDLRAIFLDAEARRNRRRLRALSTVDAFEGTSQHRGLPLAVLLQPRIRRTRSGELAPPL